jgi:phage I-like protein
MAAVAKLGIAVPEGKNMEIVSKAVLSALDLDDDANESTVVASINVMKQERQVSVSAADLQAVKDDLAARDARDAVDAAIAKGKVMPAQKEWAMDYAAKDPAGFTQYVAKAPQTIPVDALPGKTQQASDPVADDAVKAVAKIMGVSLDDIKKYNGMEV